MTSNKYDLLIVGGGSSGLMAGLVAARRGKKILIIEKNPECGRKLSITGGGRCNILNATFDVRSLIEYYGVNDARFGIKGNKDFLFSSFTKFGAKECWNFFEDSNFKLKVEDRNRAFPITESAVSVRDFFLKELELCNQKFNNVNIIYQTKVIKLNKKDNQIISVETDCKDEDYKEIEANNFLISTGGVSHPQTGSTGDGIKFLEKLNIKCVTPTQGLVPILVEDKTFNIASGNTLENVKITFYVDEIKKFNIRGNVLLTHTGLSGPLIINNSSKIGDMLHEGEVVGVLDVYPHLDIGTLDKMILDVIDKNKNKLLKNILREFVPFNFVRSFEVLIQNSNIPNLNLDIEANSITKDNRRKLVLMLKEIKFIVKGLADLEKSIVADGGVLLEEIDGRNFSIKKIPNLYVSGDVLNIRRPSGGFSLQLCWTSGFIVGNEI